MLHEHFFFTIISQDMQRKTNLILDDYIHQNTF